MAKKYIDAELLRKEIERLKTENNNIRCTANGSYCVGYDDAFGDLLSTINSLQQEQQEVDLKKFTEKMDAWKARYNHPDNIPIKATMAFTARMFYMYPNVAREWYDSLPKVSLD